MATLTVIRTGAAALLIAAAPSALRAAAVPSAPATNASTHPATVEPSELDGDEVDLMGNAGHARDSSKPKLAAYFQRESYSRGDAAELIVTDHAARISIQIVHAGGEHAPTIPNDVMLGTSVTGTIASGAVNGRRTFTIRIGSWPSGVYFARLTAAGSRVGYAPFILRPTRLGEHRIAVVLPTETWQAYNFRDDNGDGQPDTWYAGWKTHNARLARPFLNRGVPPHWNRYDAPFVRWLVQTHRDVDYFSDAELRDVKDGSALADAYDLIVFSGHHEYVTQHEYDVVTRFRDLGGNLAFLAANNFFWKITIQHDVMTRVAQWRDLGRPEAALIGVQYRANDRGGHRGPWLLRRGASTTPWLFAHVETSQGIGVGGIEIDATTAASPKSVRILAEIPDLYGPGFTAQMTYYEAPAGAKVFAAGAFSLAGSVWDDDVARLVANLWSELGSPR
jgi:hypothetical protein